MVELPVFVVKQFSWYLCFGMIIHQIPRVFTKNINESLLYNVPGNFASIELMKFSAYEKQKSA
jgi:hypothetical protein